MYDIYTIKENDTIDNVAKNFNTSPAVIYQLNGYLETLTPGMTIILPKRTNPYFDYYTIQKGDTLYAISQKYNINYKILSMLNGLDSDDYIYAGQTIMVPKQGLKIYVTADGDTLQEVIAGIGANLNEFFKQNSKIYLLPEQLIIYKEGK